MPKIVAYDDVKVNRTEEKLPTGYRWITKFMVPPAGVEGEPHAFLAEGSARRVIGTHFHRVDQFQVIVKGGGVLGKHKLALHAVHFARAHTPYGPIVGGEQGLGFLTLRAVRDTTGQHHFPKAKEELKNIPDRDPWQVTEVPKFEGPGDIVVHQFSQIRDDRGLAAFSLKLNPGAKTLAADPSTTDGQYLIITKGCLKYQGRDHRAITIVFVKPDEKPFELEAGSEGLEALVLNYPRQKPRPAAVKSAAPAIGTKLRVWQCQLCAFSYDEAKGMPEEGIAPGTRWEDVPEDWTCPDCSTSKSDFEMRVVG